MRQCIKNDQRLADEIISETKTMALVHRFMVRRVVRGFCCGVCNQVFNVCSVVKRDYS